MPSDLPSNCVVSGTPRAIGILGQPSTPQNERQLPGGAVTQSISGNNTLQLEKLIFQFLQLEKKLRFFLRIQI